MVDKNTYDYEDKPREECGVFGIYASVNNDIDVASSCYMALYALQHRGQDSCGIVVNDDGVFNYHKGLGLVSDNFTPSVMEKLGTGKIALSHVRYSPKGQMSPGNTQPLVVRHIKGPMSIANNGALINAVELRREFELKGGIFQTASDVEVIAYAVTEQRLSSASIQEALEKAMYKLKGAYSLAIMSPKKLIAARDPDGFRPLCIGTLPSGGGNDGGSYVIASETCALGAAGADYLRDVLPGEIVVIGEDGITSIKTHCGNKGSVCVFEYIYVARPDSVIGGASVHKARLNAGMYLAKEHPAEADIVIGVPDSGLDAALGFSRKSGIPYGIGFIKNRYIGRTFIQPTQRQRLDSVKIKLNPITEVVKDKRVVIVDDSIVRGTTTGIIVELLRSAGAREVHVRISSPPYVNPCYFGTDIDSRESLMASNKNIDEIRRLINADSLGYLSLEHVAKLAEGADCGFCQGCFSGKYPIEVPQEVSADKFDSKISTQGEL